MMTNHLIPAALTFITYVSLPAADTTKVQEALAIGVIYVVWLVVAVWTREWIRRRRRVN